MDSAQFPIYAPNSFLRGEQGQRLIYEVGLELGFGGKG